MHAPVLVEAPLELLAQVLSPDGLEAAQTPVGLDVTHNADHNQGWGLHNGYSLTRLPASTMKLGSALHGLEALPKY